MDAAANARKIVDALKETEAESEASRTLGARSEELRRGTWPILAWLQRYPPPAGQRADIHFFPGAEVDRNVAALE